MYDSTLGRWVQQDPSGYGDGSDLYQVERSSPESNLDPFGLNSGFVSTGPFLPWDPGWQPPNINPIPPYWPPQPPPTPPPPAPPTSNERLQQELDYGTERCLLAKVGHTGHVAVANAGAQIGATVAEFSSFVFHDAWVGRGGRSWCWVDVQHEMNKTYREIWSK